MQKNSFRVFAPFLILLCLLSFNSCMQYSSFEKMVEKQTEIHTNEPDISYDSTTSIVMEATTAEVPEIVPSEIITQIPEVPSYEITTVAPVILPEITTRAPEITTRAPEITTIVPEAATEENTSEETTAEEETGPDYSSFTKKEVIDLYSEALNKTRAYTGALTVNHTESFNADIRDAHPGGALTELLADNIVKLVGSEGQQTLNFSGGKAVNADGETIPVLLPQRTSFSLPEEGVISADIIKEGDRLHVKIVLIPETVTMGQIPKYNSSSIGYLDTSDMDFKIITISRVDISYTGSVIDAYIRSDGYIDSVNYTINMSTYAELSGMGITGYGTLEGAQTEKWELWV